MSEKINKPTTSDSKAQKKEDIEEEKALIKEIEPFTGKLVGRGIAVAL